MFIVIEGLDGAGKSTQLQRLRQHFQENGREVAMVHFPRYESPVYGGLIARFLRGDMGPNDRVDPYLVALLFAGDRQGAAQEICRLQAQGKVVIVDRYVYSNIAYQGAKLAHAHAREALRTWILDTEYKQFGIPVPHVNLFLDVPLSGIRQRLQAHRSGEDRSYLQGKADIHEADLDFQARVREIYLQQARRDPHFKVISCQEADGSLSTPEGLFRRILQTIQAL